jgi:hypothetical protein
MNHFAGIFHRQQGPASLLMFLDELLPGQGASLQVQGPLLLAIGSGIPWATILATLLPLILSLFTGGGSGLSTIIADILAVLGGLTPPATKK